MCDKILILPAEVWLNGNDASDNIVYSFLTKKLKGKLDR